MATYAIGDVQGCYRTLLELLDRISYHAGRDRLWLTGDLVNRGPRSLEVLRWAKDHDRDLVAVLGNHDLHLLGLAAGVVPPRRRDTIAEVLSAPDREPLLEWLRGRPLLHREMGYVLVHAGMLPAWTVEEAEALAGEGAAALRGPKARDLLASVLGSSAADGTSGDVARAMMAMTRLRLCQPDGSPHEGFSGSPDSAPAGSLPWFAFPGRRTQATPIVFGHWAALGLLMTPTLLALDTGCVWGGSLTAVRLEDRATFQVDCLDAAADPAPARATRRGR
jgi:bis(5'-nucleosyl)-tetraphosphatase (symmetrical)